jgi:TolA-binding protein
MVCAEAEHAAARYLEHHAARYKGSDSEYWKYRTTALKNEGGELRHHLSEQTARSEQLETRLQAAQVEVERLRTNLIAREQEAAQTQRQAREEADQWQERVNLANAEAARERELARKLHTQGAEAAVREHELALRIEKREAEIADMLTWPAWKVANAIWQSYPMRFLMRPAGRAARKRLRWLVAR